MVRIDGMAAGGHWWTAVAALTLLALAGCESFLPKFGGPPPNLYTLTPKSTFAEDLPTVTWQLVVEEPVASGGLNTDRIALRDSPTEVDYFARARWTERAPRMVQTLLVESFENSKRIVAVGRQAIGLRSDYNLKTELREFQAEYFEAGGLPSARVRLNAKLVKQPKRAIVASHTFQAVVKAKGSDMSHIIKAFDGALGKVLRDIVEWSLRRPSEPTGKGKG
ncbi:MAG: ABC-type transport auxiliary lipoprotein family protein [Alphaproteobacteria bacterium]|nr:ABC-type transport auxiliary lipoprotein family protein [Alphaproteobacteria bacterium]MDP6812632.1 ABC-type transport auxiliary lipoprotein family protein [Alphaproteobacteria bacterium]